MPLALAGRLRGITVDTRPLGVPAFRRLWLGQIVTVIGSQMTAVAVPVQVYEVTHDSVDVGLTSMVALVPLVVFGLLGGSVVDATDRRTVLLLTGPGLLLVSLALWAQALLPGPGSIPLLWTLVALQSALFAVNAPARSAVIPALLRPALVPSANALNQIVQNTGVIVGPLLAGVLIATAGLPWAYFVDASTFVVGIYTILRLPSLRPQTTRRAGLGSVVEGFAFLATRPVLLVSFGVDIIAMVFGWPRALFPQLAATTFGGAGALGWLYAASAIGALVAALLGGWLSRIDGQGRAVLWAVAVWGIAIVGFGFAGSLVVAVLCLALAGAGDMVSAVFRSSILQTAAPDEMRGRLQGVFIVVVAGGPRLGDLRSGGSTAFLSPAHTSVVGGGLVLLGVAAIAVGVPSFRRYSGRSAAAQSARAPQSATESQSSGG